MPHVTMTFVIQDSDDLDSLVEANCQPRPGGHIAAVRLGGLTIQASADGTRRMVDLLEIALRKVTHEHRRWLAESAAAAEGSS